MRVSDEVEALRGVLSREPRLRWAYLFGSAARGERHRDLDVAVMPDAGGADSLGMVELGVIVAELESRTGRSIDLVDLTSAPLPLVGPMLQERVVLLDRDPAARHAWEAEATSRWIDFRPAYERYSAVRRAALRRRLDRGR